MKMFQNSLIFKLKKFEKNKERNGANTVTFIDVYQSIDALSTTNDTVICNIHYSEAEKWRRSCKTAGIKEPLTVKSKLSHLFYLF